MLLNQQSKTTCTSAISRELNYAQKQSIVFDCLKNNVCTPFNTYLKRSLHSKNTSHNGLSVKLLKSGLNLRRRAFTIKRSRSLIIYQSNLHPKIQDFYWRKYLTLRLRWNGVWNDGTVMERWKRRGKGRAGSQRKFIKSFFFLLHWAISNY